MPENPFAKYVSYRRRYVEHFAEHAPERAPAAVRSEIARLAFVATGSAINALLMWLLAPAALAAAKPGWAAFAAGLALAATVSGILALFGLRDALRHRRALLHAVGP